MSLIPGDICSDNLFVDRSGKIFLANFSSTLQATHKLSTTPGLLVSPGDDHGSVLGGLRRLQPIAPGAPRACAKLHFMREAQGERGVTS